MLKLHSYLGTKVTNHSNNKHAEQNKDPLDTGKNNHKSKSQNKDIERQY